MNGTDKIRGPHFGRNAVGRLFEGVVATAIGARRWPSWPAISVPRDVAADDDGDRYDLHPDLFWPEETALVEVKAGVRRFYTTRHQLDAYRWVRRFGRAPLDRPRVFYAFVAYRTELPVGKRRSVAELETDALAGLRYVLVLDAIIVDRLVDEYGSYGRDFCTPLSPMLGKWRDAYRFTPARLLPLMSATRIALTRRFGGDFRVRDIGERVRVIRRKRRPRRWRGPLPFEQGDLFDPTRSIPAVTVSDDPVFF